MTKAPERELPGALGDGERPAASRTCAWCDEPLDAAADAAARTSHGICAPCLEAVTRGFVTPLGGTDREEP